MTSTRVTPPLRPLRLVVPAAVVVFVLLAGCADRGNVLARVGQQTITVADFNDAAGPVAAQMAGPPDSAKRQLLDDLVRRALLIEEARRRHLIADSTLVSDRQKLAKQLALQSLLQKLAPQPTVTPAEVRAFYDAQANESHAQVVFSPNESDIRAAKAALDGGTDFGTVADRYNTLGMLPPHGDIGWVSAGGLVEPIDDLIITSPLHKVVGPVQAPGTGWFILQVLERRPHVRPAFEAQSAMLENMLKQRKQRTVLQRAVESLKQQYDVTVAPDGAQTVFARYNAPRDAAGGFGNPPAPTPAQAAHALASWKSPDGKVHSYTLGDAVHDLQDPTVERPDFARVAVIGQWIQSRVLQQVAVVEADRRHLAEEPDVQRRVRDRVDNELVQAMFDVAGRGAVADSADIRAAYDRHASMFVKLTRAHLAIAVTRDSGAALQLAATASGGTQLRAAAALVKPPLAVTEQTIQYPSTTPMWQGLQAALTASSPNDVRGPFRTPMGWMVFQLLDKQQAGQRFEELSPQIMQALQNEALEAARERRLQALTDSLRIALKPEVHPERLAKVTWPAATAAPGAAGAPMGAAPTRR